MLPFVAIPLCRNTRLGRCRGSIESQPGVLNANMLTRDLQIERIKGVERKPYQPAATLSESGESTPLHSTQNITNIVKIK